KGTYAALDRANFFLKKHTWFAKMDVRKYFDTINHETLKEQLARLFKDNNLLGIFGEIIGSYQTGHNTGLPIGNLTSQYFANHYLSQADHYALQNLKVPAFIRYMDDILLFDSNKEGLKIKTEQFVKYLHEKLKLEVKPVVYENRENGLPFLGYKLFPQTIKLNQRSKKRFKRKLKTYSRFVNSGIWSEKEFQEHVLPLLSFIRYADTFHFRKNCTFAIEG
nr:RNA-directed DNA polymerase [Bacteroidota bacterium]